MSSFPKKDALLTRCIPNRKGRFHRVRYAVPMMFFILIIHMTSKTKKNKIVLGVLGLMLSLTLVAGVGVQTANAALTTSQVDAIISLLTSFGADTSTISNVRASLTGGTPSAPPMGTGYTFTRNLK